MWHMDYLLTRKKSYNSALNEADEAQVAYQKACTRSHTRPRTRPVFKHGFNGFLFNLHTKHRVMGARACTHACKRTLIKYNLVSKSSKALLFN